MQIAIVINTMEYKITLKSCFNNGQVNLFGLHCSFQIMLLVWYE